MRERLPFSRRELIWLAWALAVGVGIRVAYVLLTRHHPLVGDQFEYDLEGRFIADGHWFWTTTPFGHARATEWKAPVYPAWVGTAYSLFGAHPTGVRLIQAAIVGPITIGLTALIGLRLFGTRAAVTAGWLFAVYPNAWQWEERLFSESLATPLTAAVLLAVLPERPLTKRRAIAVGLLLGLSVLLRPTAVMLIPCVAVAWWMAARPRLGTTYLAVTVGVAILCIAPWTIRNANVSGGFIPISLQDMSAYGTFNSESANDPSYPYAWRVAPRPLRGFLTKVAPHLSDVELRARLQRKARDYIREHPFAVAEAFYWNGITRTWDVRSPAHILDEVKPEGRTRGVAVAGLVLYWLLLPPAVYALWLLRRRKRVLLPILALALSASILFTSDAVTRYRAPLEPLIVVLASAGALATPFARRGAPPISLDGPPAGLPASS